jgi:hypothetical protein
MLSPDPLPRLCGVKLPSASSPRQESLPTNKRRHIHFDDKVVQFIGVVDAEDGEDGEHGVESYPASEDDESSSDDGVLMMRGSSKLVIPKKCNRTSPRCSFNDGGSSIAMLPCTKLRDCEDAQELTRLAVKQQSGLRNSGLSQFPLLRQYPKILGDTDGEDAGISRRPPGASGMNKAVARAPLSDQNASSKVNAGGERTNLHSAHSGIFMTSREGADDMEAVSLLSWVADTVNTAKDIAFVIRNVGWRT